MQRSFPIPRCRVRVASNESLTIFKHPGPWNQKKILNCQWFTHRWVNIVVWLIFNETPPYIFLRAKWEQHASIVPWLFQLLYHESIITFAVRATYSFTLDYPQLGFKSKCRVRCISSTQIDNNEIRDIKPHYYIGIHMNFAIFLILSENGRVWARNIKFAAHFVTNWAQFRAIIFELKFDIGVAGVMYFQTNILSSHTRSLNFRETDWKFRQSNGL